MMFVLRCRLAVRTLLLTSIAHWMIAIGGVSVFDAHATTPVFDSDKLLRAARILKATDSQTWPAAYRELDAVPELQSYVIWQQLLDADTDVSFAVYLDFLSDHPDWPRLDSIRRRTESSIDQTISTAQRLAYFQRYPALSRDGRLRLIEAYLDDQQQARARDLARKTWVENGFSKSAQRAFLRDHGKFLRPDDHSARLHRLLWDGRSAEAQRMFDLVGRGDKAIAVARIRLQQMAKGVDGAIARVPAELLRDPGLLYDRLLWRRRKGRDADAREILLDPPDDLVRPTLWWNERQRQTNKLIGERRFGEAKALVGLHGQTSGLPFAEAEWLSGWLSLRFINDPAEALAHFERLYAAVRSPISLGRAGYWAGRASDALGAPGDAQRWYQKAADHPTSFYGQAAAAELGIESDLPATSLVIGGQSPGAASLASLIRLLCLMDAREEVLPFLRQMMTTDTSVTQAMNLAVECGRPEVYLDLAKRGLRQGLLDAASSYPVPQLPAFLEPDTSRADAALVLAVARQESQFAIDAKSPVGALGLMQLMPATAKEVARRLGLPFATRRLRYDADYNLQIGGFYLDGLLKRYGDVDYLSVAAYNAGPGAVTRWIRRNGDPRSMNLYDRLDWLELIPYAETRNYVQRVLEGRRNYSAILRSDSGIHIRLNPRRGPLVPLPLSRPQKMREAS